MNDAEADPSRMNCAVYRASGRNDTYLFVPSRDRFEALPAALLRTVGRLDFVMELELTAGRRLARVEATEVMRQLRERGYYLQLPPPEDTGR